MANLVVLVATILGTATAIAALATLAMELYVVSGTFFVFTSFAIYIRETRS